MESKRNPNDELELLCESYLFFALSDFFYPPPVERGAEPTSEFSLSFKGNRDWTTILKRLLTYVLWVPIAVKIDKDERITETHFAEIRRLAILPLSLEGAQPSALVRILPTATAAVGVVDVAVPHPFLLAHSERSPVISSAPRHPVDVLFVKAADEQYFSLPPSFHDLRMMPSAVDYILVDKGAAPESKIHVRFPFASIYGAFTLGLLFDFLKRNASLIAREVAKVCIQNSSSIPEGTLSRQNP